MAYGTKSAIKADYLAGLADAYEWARNGGPVQERGLHLAGEAADKALAGKMRLEGEVWYAALAANGVHKAAPLRVLAELPD